VTRAGVVALVAGLATVALGAAAPTAVAADECRGLPVCLPVAGPWVVIPAPAPGARTSSVEWELRCPLRGYIVAGTDVRLSDRGIDVSFRGESGSPVAPGVTTRASAVFTAVYTGTARKATSFRPFIGCIPTQGGGGRAQTVHAPRTLSALRPGNPLERRVGSVRFGTGATRSVTAACQRGDRLVGSSHALGFHTALEPGASLLGLAQATHVERARSVVGRGAASSALPGGIRVELQVHALCARSGR
jgi:hypothetical protein